ncbi:cysteine-rich CWC family protein [Acetobacter malorum]|uniref:cysteine-rich CWC family protein n=1 Tax=Acetobacter malorum TaxID=178901 RepID=UPI0039EBF897
MRCEECGTEFPCTADAQCWCMQRPHDVPLPADAATGCLCPACLEKRIRQQHRILPASAGKR